MIIIGEKINGTRKAVARAIRDRDTEFIGQLARDQSTAGASYIDVNAGTASNREPDDMVWLVETIQEVCNTPLCLDSANPEALLAGIEISRQTPLINSVSGEKARIEGVLPLALEHKTGLVLLALDDKGIPETTAGRLEIVHQLVALAKEGGLKEEQLFVDPLVTAISTGITNGLITFETINKIKEAYPQIHVTCGLSNISFGMPLRHLINHTFAPMAIKAGLDSAIADPNDRQLLGSIMAAEMLMGKDSYCMNFNKAFRAGRIGAGAK